MIRKIPQTFLFLLWQFVFTVTLLLWTIFRPALRFIAAILMVIAIFALTADVTRWQISDVPPLFHSLAHHIEAMAPATYEGMVQKISALHPMVWDYGLFVLLSAPAWLIFALLSVVIAIAGRERRRRVNIFIN